MNPSTHVLVLPYPYQGHVIPFMALSHQLVKHGFAVTFVNTEFNHKRVVDALSDQEVEGIRLVSVPDGLAPGENHNDLGKITDALQRAVPPCLEEIITKSNQKGDGDGVWNPITWMIVDENMAFVIPVAEKLGIRVAAFWSASAATLAIMISIPKLIQDGILDENGLPERNEIFQLSEGFPPIQTCQFSWNNAGDSEAQKIIFDFIMKNNKFVERAEFILCNSFRDLESPTFQLFPQLLPVGPLMADQSFSKPIGHFWKTDTTCLEWLDNQPKSSVIYVAFGSLTVFDKCQFEEIALGLELSNRAFLWVVRPDLTSQIDSLWLEEYKSRILGRGLVVEWCPQQQILAHSAIAAFVSHCGWNSTLEGVMNGVPFICWPYFVDQFVDQSYICNVWKTGIRMNPEDKAIITRDEIKQRVEELLGDEEIKARALRLKEAGHCSIAEGGSSCENFRKIVDIMKG